MLDKEEFIKTKPESYWRKIFAVHGEWELIKPHLRIVESEDDIEDGVRGIWYFEEGNGRCKIVKTYSLEDDDEDVEDYDDGDYEALVDRVMQMQSKLDALQLPAKKDYQEEDSEYNRIYQEENINYNKVYQEENRRNKIKEKRRNKRKEEKKSRKKNRKKK